MRANAGCPLAKREYKQLKWAVPAPELGDWSVTAVPLSCVRRVTHVVPYFLEMSCHRGVRAKPARYDASLEERRSMRFFENGFFPWDKTDRRFALVASSLFTSSRHVLCPQPQQPAVPPKPDLPRGLSIPRTQLRLRRRPLTQSPTSPAPPPTPGIHPQTPYVPSPQKNRRTEEGVKDAAPTAPDGGRGRFAH